MRAATILLASALALGAGVAQADSQSFNWPEAADTNSDDMISRDEAMVLSDAKFREFDVDGNGEISLTEWRRSIDNRLAAVKLENPDVKGPGDLAAFTSKTFMTHDADNNGAITRAEWDARVEAHFSRLDSNGNGMIERNEISNTIQGQKKGN